MKTANEYYDIYPKVVKAEVEFEICIKPIGAQAAFKQNEEYVIGVFPILYKNCNQPNKEYYSVQSESDGCIRFNHIFENEQEHFIRVFKNDKLIVQLSVYSVNDDLAGKYPFIGDLHLHTFYSDGNESPLMVAANYRKMGYDFIAITDHHRYYPSLEVIEAYKELPLSFSLIPGEEVHLPDNYVHIVNFGGEYSVNGLIETSAQIIDKGEDKSKRSLKGLCPELISLDEYKNQVNTLIEKLDIPEGVSPFDYASCVWAFENIKKANGLGIFAHPYWISDTYQIPWNMIEALLKSSYMDAFEVLGGERYLNQNEFQTAHYNEMKQKGINFPIVGSSDSHGSVNNINACLAKTMVFSPENEKDSLISSIKSFYSIAIDNISAEYRLVGDFRLMRYARFLMDNYFPIHNDNCFEEGRLMLEYSCGDIEQRENAEKLLNIIGKRTDKLLKKYFKF